MSTCLPQIQLDIKCATDPLIKLPIVVLPVFESSEKKQPLPSAGIGFEPFESPMQTQWSAAPKLPQQPQQQQRAALQPVEPPPAYGAHALYPLFPTSYNYTSTLWKIVLYTSVIIQHCVCIIFQNSGWAAETHVIKVNAAEIIFFFLI